jgi:hypothetical protein
MGLSACVRQVNGRPMLVVSGEPTTEFWCYGQPNAIGDFVAGGVRICQFHVVHGDTWWRGDGRYDFAGVEQQFDEFLRQAPHVLLIPRIGFGYKGEGWWAEQHPDELSVGCRLDGTPADYTKERCHHVDNWYSAGSGQWARDAAVALAAFVRHFEQRNGENVLGYQIGGGISCEWFRWWNFVEEVYEDYSPAAQRAFRAYLRERYKQDAALQAAWGRRDVTLATAEVPSPARQHRPQLGYFRDPVAERDVIDWLQCLTELNVGQILTLAAAAKQACERRKLVGVFYGYLWPHWNTQSPARSGHLGLGRLLASPDIDYISSPFHYDNRGVGGFHHSQTVPQAIERAGKLHVDEIDSPTHLEQGPQHWPYSPHALPTDAETTRQVLRRDAAAVLGTAGTAWWMDLRHSRWFADEQIHAELRETQALARQAREWSVESRAEVALVIDDASTAYCDLRSNLNQYFTSLPRQFEWGDLGFPLDTVLLSEVGGKNVSDAFFRRYKVWLFLNAWHVDDAARATMLERVRQPGVTSVWFYGAGFFDGQRCGAEGVSELVGMRVAMQTEAVVPEIEVQNEHSPLTAPAADMPRGGARFGARLRRGASAGEAAPGKPRCGARLRELEEERLVRENPRSWDTPAAPVFAVTDENATALGRYLHDGSVGLACVERDGWRSIYCGAPMLPGWLLARIAATAGVHAWTPPGCTVHQRGPLVAVYAPQGGTVAIQAPRGQRLSPLELSAAGQEWQAGTEWAKRLTLPFGPRQTRFFVLEA